MGVEEVAFLTQKCWKYYLYKGRRTMLKSRKWPIFLAGLVAAVLVGFSMGNAATLGSHYPYGVEGVLAGSAPPPGFHYRMYNTWYSPNTYKDNNGDKVPVNFGLDVFASVQRLIYVSKTKILGADYICDILIPLVDKDVTFGPAHDSRSFTLGDIVFEPFALGWHQPRWDATFALAVIAPTGDFDATKLASPGLGYWSGMMTLGATYYFDEQRTWSISALTRTLINGEQDDTHVTPGAEFVVEYGIGKENKIGNSLMVRPGLVGASYWQISDDSNDGPTTVADERKQSHAIGAEINVFWLPQLLQVNLRYLHDFHVKNNTEGSQVVLTLTKSF